MEIAVFGLSVSSSWGNGHATLWRGLIHALARLGHRVVFYEWDAPYYAAHRDCFGLPNGELRLYEQWSHVRSGAAELLKHADVGIVTSYCPHAREATELLLESSTPTRVFYDLDSPITLDRIARGESVEYVGPRGFADFDLVLSYAGGRTLSELSRVLGARRVEPLYGSVDPDLHTPKEPIERYRADLSYLGTYAADRQPALERLYLEPATRCPKLRFALGGSQYPADFPWGQNIFFHAHVPPAEHAAYYCSARLNLNITRAAMAAMGFCPSGRLFEAAACGASLISDSWEGLASFYTPGQEILVANSSEDVIAALSLSDQELTLMGRRARERTLDEHTMVQRARELVQYLEGARRAAASTNTHTPTNTRTVTDISIAE